jgi:hypothetical protein
MEMKKQDSRENIRIFLGNFVGKKEVVKKEFGVSGPEEKK